LLSFESSSISWNAISQVEVAKNLADLVDGDPRIPASVSKQQSVVTNGIHQSRNPASAGGNKRNRLYRKRYGRRATRTLPTMSQVVSDVAAREWPYLQSNLDALLDLTEVIPVQ
jgi:hypothetical protein